MNRILLLNPGPVTLSKRVRQALLREDMCHREMEFAALTQDIKSRLNRVYPETRDQFESVLLTGSGTCAVEAMLSSLIPVKGKALVVSNGVYGERMAAMLAAHGKPFIQIKADWTAPIDLNRVERQLACDNNISHLLSVHHETTTGRLNDIATLGQLCKAYNKPLLLDAVSSFGGEYIDWHNWSLGAVAGTANKCLHGVPGLAFVLVDKTRLREGHSHANTLYLDLFKYYQEQQSGFSPFTQAVQVAFALQEALRELEENGGWQTRHAQYQRLSTHIRQTLNDLGVRQMLDEASYASMLTSFYLPERVRYNTLHDLMRQAGFVIYAGQGVLADKIFRIANMGDIQADDLQNLLETLTRIFGKNHG
jgi:2-aminoethylphosphonate-pyruvate transaminase